MIPNELLYDVCDILMHDVASTSGKAGTIRNLALLYPFSVFLQDKLPFVGGFTFGILKKLDLLTYDSSFKIAYYPYRWYGVYDDCDYERFEISRVLPDILEVKILFTEFYEGNDLEINIYAGTLTTAEYLFGHEVTQFLSRLFRDTLPLGLEFVGFGEHLGEIEYMCLRRPRDSNDGDFDDETFKMITLENTVWGTYPDLLGSFSLSVECIVNT